MKAFFVMCALVCFGCSDAPDTNTNQPVYGSASPNREPGSGMPSDQGFNACSAGWRFVTVWVNGQPVPQWQPVICNQEPDPNTGDPMTKFRGDPDPTQQPVQIQEQLVNLPSAQKMQH